MRLRHIATGEILNNCYINNYNNQIELEIYDSDLKDFRVIEIFKTLKEFLNNYEEY